MMIDAWIDETAGKGTLKRLADTTDHDFALFVALLIDDESRQSVLEVLAPPFELFRAAAPVGAKLHITDAFAADGPSAWRDAAIQARQMIFHGLKATGPRVVYAARRFGVARAMHDSSVELQRMGKASAEERHPDWKFPKPDDTGRVDAEAFRDLMLLLDCVGRDCGNSMVHPRMDNVDTKVAAEYLAELDDLRDNGPVPIQSSAYNVQQKVRKTARAEMTIDIDFAAEVTCIAEPIVEHEIGPELFAVDVIANGLSKHLRGLDAAASLYGPTATSEWEHGELIAASNRVEVESMGLF